MFWNFMTRFRPLALMLTLLFLVTACGPSARPTATMTPSPTDVPTSTPTQISTTVPSATPAPTSTPLPEIALDIDLPEGDPQKGFTTAIVRGCYGCHVDETYPSSGPRFVSTAELPHILERGEMRIALPDYKGKATTNREYIIESIFLPEAYIVPGDWKLAMPAHLGGLMTDQDLADVLAWIATLE
ncbi:MAG: hypothetical protein PVG14_20375 [Anaerolineales bacterium]